jgi:transposase-like protein
MAATESPTQRARRSRWPAAEKRRIVELTERPGASVPAIAREHGVNPNSLYRWTRLYCAGKLDAQVKSASRVASLGASATFVPVNVVRAVRSPQPAARPDGTACRSGIMQLVLASGATLRIETGGALDAALVCALVAELRR